MLAKNTIIDDLKSLGIKQGDAVVVHSSYKKIGNVDGGPVAVIDALIDTVLPEGALLFPNLNILREFTVDDPPRFDLKKCHIKNLGIIPELFKFQYAEHFSIHPTHSMMGVGAKAYDILKGHEKAGVCCGRGTPWEKNALAGGKILLIGVDHFRNTSYHCVEEQIENTYKLSKEVVQGVVIVDDEEIVVPSRLHIWEGRAPNFNILNDELMELGYLKTGKIGMADTLCVDAGGFVKVGLEKVRLDSRYFLADEE